MTYDSLFLLLQVAVLWLVLCGMVCCFFLSEECDSYKWAERFDKAGRLMLLAAFMLEIAGIPTLAICSEFLGGGK